MPLLSTSQQIYQLVILCGTQMIGNGSRSKIYARRFCRRKIFEATTIYTFAAPAYALTLLAYPAHKL
jgi:hypothetical protein